MMANTTVSNVEFLFPTAVMFTHIGREITPEELKSIHEYHANSRKIGGNTISNDFYVLENPELKNLKAICTEYLNRYLQEIYKPKYPLRAYVTQSWLNFTEHGEYHHIHQHPNSFISGVLYVQTNPKTDKITFHKDMYQQIKVTSNKFDKLNSDSWWFSAKPNEVVLFPSYLTHNVEDKESKGTRISLAFNSFLSGKLGDGPSLTELELR